MITHSKSTYSVVFHVDLRVNDIYAFPDGWSEWYTPESNAEGVSFYIGIATLGDKSIGDIYTCQIEVEFMDVSAADRADFKFDTQGKSDGAWKKGNIWNSKLIWKGAPPEDGVYQFSSSVVIDESMVDVSIFELGFRCDNWASGSFRVRDIKIEKGGTTSEWSPGL